MSKAQTKIVQDAGINEAIIAPLKPDMKYIAMMAPKEATISGTQNMPRGQQLCSNKHPKLPSMSNFQQHPMKPHAWQAKQKQIGVVQNTTICKHNESYQ